MRRVKAMMQMMNEAGHTAHAMSSRTSFVSAAPLSAVFVCFPLVLAVVVLLITGRVATPVVPRTHIGRRAA